VAGYDDLTAIQQLWFDIFMAMPVRLWPDELKSWCNDQGPITCGDHWADVVGNWVKKYLGYWLATQYQKGPYQLELGDQEDG
jgi:hypothetical protein